MLRTLQIHYSVVVSWTVCVCVVQTNDLSWFWRFPSQLKFKVEMRRRSRGTRIPAQHPTIEEMPVGSSFD